MSRVTRGRERGRRESAQRRLLKGGPAWLVCNRERGGMEREGDEADGEDELLRQKKGRQDVLY